MIRELYQVLEGCQLSLNLAKKPIFWYSPVGNLGACKSPGSVLQSDVLQDKTTKERAVTSQDIARLMKGLAEVFGYEKVPELVPRLFGRSTRQCTFIDRANNEFYRMVIFDHPGCRVAITIRQPKGPTLTVLEAEEIDAVIVQLRLKLRPDTSPDLVTWSTNKVALA